MPRRVLFRSFLLLFVAAAGHAHATMGPAVKVSFVEAPGPAALGVPVEGTLRVTAGRTMQVGDFGFRDGAWDGRVLDAPGRVTLEAGEFVDLRFTASTLDPSVPLDFEFTLDGQPTGRRLDVGAPRHTKRTRATTLVEDPRGVGRPFPGATPDPRLQPVPTDRPAAKDHTPSLSRLTDESADVEWSGGLQRRANITVQGRFVYRRQDGQTRGVDNATVRVYDEDTGPDNKVAEGLTDVDGYYSFTFDWDPCALCDKRPDLYVEFELNNSEVTVESAVFEVNYTFASGTLSDFEGSFHDFGWLGPQEEDLQPAPHIFNHVLRSWRWIVNNTPHDPPSVDVQWPGTGAFYNSFFEEIHLDEARQWNEDTCAHEYGHHFIENYAQSRTPSYCNGICDTREEWYEVWDDCGHCIWCEENDRDAWNEGWPNWLADVVTRDHTATYGYAVLNTRNMESVRECFVDNAYDGARVTEGFIAALLRDIEDSTNDDEADFAGEDRLSWGVDEIFTVVVQDDPLTPVDFLARFLTRYGNSPELNEAIWFTAANNGYETDNANPGVVGNLTSSSHQVGVDSPDNTIRFTWSTAPDDRSGIQGYGLFISTSGPGLPGAVQDIGDEQEFTTEPLSPGTYYFNIRARDNAGKWSSNYASAGPYVIREPTPANLTFDVNTGWGAFVVPRTTADAQPTSVPAPTLLPGAVKGTYWNVRTENVGESSASCCPRVNVMVDGFNVFSSPFDPQDVYDTIAGLGAGTADNSLNQGPIRVLGGRHTFGAFIDSAEEIAESVEGDNKTARQWVWTPFELTPDTRIDRNHPPDRDGGWAEASGTTWYNVDGLRFRSDPWWSAVWVHSTNDARDVDLRLHEPSTGATNGFTSNVGWSTRGPGELDAVIVNRNVTGAQDWDVGVMQATNDYASGLYRAESVTNTNFTFGDSTSTSIPSGTMLQLREVFVPVDGAGPVSVTVQLDPALGPDYPALQVAWFGETFGTGDLNDATALGITDADDGFARITVEVPDSGFNGLLVYRDPTQGTASWDYTLEVDRAPPDWRPAQPTRWYAPAVPHLADADLIDLVAPTILYGNVPETYVSFNIANDGGTGSNGPFQAFTRIDGIDVAGSVWSDWAAGLTRTVQARGPLTIDGGRHTLTVVCDPQNEYEEISEENNVFGEQWIWTPLPLALDAPVTRDHPEGRTVGWTELGAGTGKWYNADGLRTPVFAPDGTTGYWAAVSAVPGAGGDVDIRWHLPSTGPKDGFAANLAFSGWGPEQTDLLLVNFNETAFAALDVGVLKADGSSTLGTGYTAETVQSTLIGSSTSYAGGPYSIGSGHAVRLLEVQLDAGVHVIRLQNASADVDLGFSLYGPGDAYYAKSDAMAAAWFEPEGEDEWITIDVPVAGYHALAVWKRGADDLALSADFSLRINTGATDAPPAGPALAASRIETVKPNPFNPRTTVAFELRTDGAVGVEVLNVRGERVRTLRADALYAAGRHEVVWNGTDDAGRPVGSGTYFVLLRTADGVDRAKVTLVK